MSNGLADASFFPTAKELSTGLRWFKDHPVLAAAAATAVSVITYLNATESLAHSRSSASLLDDAEDEREGEPNDDDRYDGDSVSCFRGGGGGSSSSPGGATYRKRDVGVVVARRRVELESASGEKITVTDTVATTTVMPVAGSDGKLSAAVSWCDEHGGSLTQVFEDLHVADEWSEHDPVECSNRNGSERQNASVSVEASSGASRICDTNRPPMATASSLPRPVGVAIRKSSTQQSILSAMDGGGGGASADSSQSDIASGGPLSSGQQRSDINSPGTGDIELQTESPQWGWYVAITPPQDHIHPNLPRATLQPHRALYPGSNSARVSNAAAMNSTLRRSISGKIP
ncbi:hypothetical protein Gpo141_00009422 [Globisporangium polare]